MASFLVAPSTWQRNPCGRTNENWLVSATRIPRVTSSSEAVLSEMNRALIFGGVGGTEVTWLTSAAWRRPKAAGSAARLRRRRMESSRRNLVRNIGGGTRGGCAPFGPHQGSQRGSAGGQLGRVIKVRVETDVAGRRRVVDPGVLERGGGFGAVVKTDQRSVQRVGASAPSLQEAGQVDDTPA